jgi:hypothetical protein
MIVVVVVGVIGVLLPFTIILATVAWGWRHGTLSETPQERYDWEFEQIVRRVVRHDQDVFL